MRECPKCGSFSTALHSGAEGIEAMCLDCQWRQAPFPTAEEALDVWNRLPRQTACLLDRTPVQCRPMLCCSCGHNPEERARRLERIRSEGLARDADGNLTLRVKIERGCQFPILDDTPEEPD